MATLEPGDKRGFPIVTWLVAAGTLIGTSVLVFRRKPALSSVGEDVGRGNPSTPPSSRARRLGFEPHEMSPRVMILTLFGLFASAGLGVAVIFGLLAILHGRREANAPPTTPEERARIETPEPHLQVRPFQELYAEHGRERGLIDSYAWIDPGHTRARIPIDRAMQLVVGRSLDGASPSGGGQR